MSTMRSYRDAGLAPWVSIHVFTEKTTPIILIPNALLVNLHPLFKGTELGLREQPFEVSTDAAASEAMGTIYKSVWAKKWLVFYEHQAEEAYKHYARFARTRKC